MNLQVKRALQPYGENMKMKFIKMGINGEGIGYADNNIPVFCDGVFPGEEAEVEIIQKNKTYWRAQVVRMTFRSKERVRTNYKYAVIEGCPLFEMKYPAQLVHKKELLQEALIKYANVKSTFVRDIHPSPLTLGYRSACKLPVQEDHHLVQTGMYTPRTNHWHVIEHSLIQDPLLEKTRVKILKRVGRSHLHVWDPKEEKGLRYLVMRSIDGKVQCTLVTGKDKIHKELIEEIMEISEMQGLFQSINTEKKTTEIFGSEVHKLAGEDTQSVDMNGIVLQLSPESFFQLNIPQAKELYQMAVSKIDPCDTLVEAYCGIGAMSLMAHEKAAHIYGIESIPDAVENAAINARINGIDNAEFICADAAKGLKQIAAKTKIDTILVDPPRSGMDDDMIQSILDAKPKKIIYVSCNPATLARNLKVLKHKYHVVTIIPYDLFPHTPLVESITVLERG
jgi:23S rRNA (uracil1939-C5)-methyltransferase